MYLKPLPTQQNPSEMNNQPSKYFHKLLAWFCHDNLYEELQGDLEEAFQKNVQTKGLSKAKAIYRKEVLKMIRPSVMKVKRPAGTFTLSLFKGHFILSLRMIR